MPKTLRWVATGDAAATFATPANWIDESTGATPGSAPANDDTFRFVSGNTPVAGAATGLSNCNIVVGKNYKGTIAPGSTLGIDLVSLKHYGYTGNYGGAITSAEIEPASPNAKINLNPGAAKTVGVLFAKNAMIEVGENCVLTTLRQVYGNIVVGANATAITDAFVESGSFKTFRDARIRVGPGARTSFEGLVAKIITGSAIEGKGQLLYKTAVDLASSAEVEVRPGGIFRCNESRAPFNARTFNLWPGHNANFETADGKATVTENKYGIDDEVGGFTPI